MLRARLYPLSVCLMLLVPLLAGAQQPDRNPPKRDNIMQKKLAAAQKLLGALALNEYDKIKEYADTLNDLSKQAAWKYIETPRYEFYSDEFQRLTLRMSNQAKEHNIDGAALSYVDLTLICVKCHQHVREQKIGRNPGPARRGGDER